MSNQIQSEVEGLFHQSIPKFNTAIDQAIAQKGMNPLGHLLSDSQTIGIANLGLCQARANASFSIVDVTGLNQAHITSLTVGTLHPKNSTQTEFYGTFSMQGTIPTIQSHVTGRMEASCAFIHPSEGIDGTLDSVATFTVSGAFTVTVSGNNLSIVQMSVQSVNVLLTQENFHLNNLGILNELQVPLEDCIVNAYKYRGKQTLQSMFFTALQDGFQKMLPLK
jgi:hypothetical protein